MTDHRSVFKIKGRRKIPTALVGKTELLVELILNAIMLNFINF